MKKKFMKTLAAALIVSTLFSVAAYAAEWEKRGSNWYYVLDDGNVATSSWINDEDGSSYYVGSDGIMQKDAWVPSGDKWYYVGSDGALLRNTMVGTNNDTTWYLLGADGAMQSNIWYQDPEGDWYYFGPDGAAYKDGWYYIDGYEYYFLKSSKMAHDALVPGGGSVGSDGRRIR